MKKRDWKNDKCIPNELLRSLGWPEAPKKVWQAPFDYFRGHCERIADTSSPTQLFDFAEYFLDYQYMTVQEDLLAFVFPKAIEAWARQELDEPAHELFEAEWHFEGMRSALSHRPIHPEFFNAKQFSAMTDFFVNVLLIRMQKEKSLAFQGSGASPYDWIYLHATLIWQFPVAEQIWNNWWSLDTPELAVCAIQWISSFIYNEDDNPYFKPWTDREGGGPPTVFETYHMRKKAAPLSNSEFIRNVFTKEWAESALFRAVEVLSNHEQADLVYETWLDISRRSDVFEERVEKLVALMEQDESEMVISWDQI